MRKDRAGGGTAATAAGPCAIAITLYSDEPLAFAPDWVRGSLEQNVWSDRSETKLYWSAAPDTVERRSNSGGWNGQFGLGWSSCGGDQTLNIEIAAESTTPNKLALMSTSFRSRRCRAGSTVASGFDEPATAIPASDEFVVNGGLDGPQPTPGLTIENVSFAGLFPEVAIAPDKQNVTLTMLAREPSEFPSSDGTWRARYDVDVIGTWPKGKTIALEGLAVRGHALMEAGTHAEISLIPQKPLAVGDSGPEHAKVIAIPGPINAPLHITQRFEGEDLIFAPCGATRFTFQVGVKVDNGDPFGAARIDLTEISTLKFALRDCPETAPR